MTKNKDKVEVLDKKGKVLGVGILKKKKNDGQKLLLEQKISFYKGPLPPAEELEKYSNLHPKFVEILLKDFERNSKLREKCNKDMLKAQIELDRKSQNHGFFVSILMIIGAMFCAYYKQTIIGSALVGVSVLGIIKALLPNKEK